MYVVFVGDLLN